MLLKNLLNRPVEIPLLGGTNMVLKPYEEKPGNDDEIVKERVMALVKSGYIKVTPSRPKPVLEQVEVKQEVKQEVVKAPAKKPRKGDK